MNEFYVYVLFRLDTGVPCYVGKGKGRRAWNHTRAGAGHSNPHLGRIIVNHGVAEVIVRGRLTEQEAFATEIAFIAAIGREKHGGPLVNLTAGGDGMAGGEEHPNYGRSHSEATKAKMRAAHAGNNRGGAQHYMFGKSHTEEARKKISDAMRGNTHLQGKSPSEETRKKISASLKGRASPMTGRQWSEETRAKQKAARVGKPLSEEHRAAISAAHQRARVRREKILAARARGAK